MTPTKTGTNGKAVIPTTTTAQKSATSTTNGTQTESNLIVKMETTNETILPTIQDTNSVFAIQEKTENLSKLFTKRGKVLAVKKQVDNFKISADKETSTIHLWDGNGNEFQSNNPELIREAMKVVSERVEAGLKEVDTQILTHAAA